MRQRPLECRRFFVTSASLPNPVRGVKRTFLVGEGIHPRIPEKHPQVGLIAQFQASWFRFQYPELPQQTFGRDALLQPATKNHAAFLGWRQQFFVRRHRSRIACLHLTE